LIFAVIQERRALVDAATSKTREARRFSERRDRALDGARVYEVEDADLKLKKSENVLRNHPGFEVEEWS